MRNRIIMATIEEINENGIKFTMADLARRLAVSKTTIYIYFNSKEELICAIGECFREDMRQHDEAIMNNSSLDIRGKIKALLLNEPEILGLIMNRFILDLKRHMPKEWERSVACRDHKWQLIELLLREGIKNEFIRPVDLTVAKVIFNATINEFFSQNFLMQNNLTAVDAVGKMSDILYNGMAASSADRPTK